MSPYPRFQRFVSLTEVDVPHLLARRTRQDLGIDGERYGVLSRLIARPQATVPDLAVAVTEKLCAAHRLDASALGGLVLSSRSVEIADYLNQTVQRLRLDCEALSIERACSGFPAATELAVALATRLVAPVGVITAEIISRNINWEPSDDTRDDHLRARAQASKLFADGAAAVLVLPPGAECGHEILDAWHGEAADDQALIQKTDVVDARDAWGNVQPGVSVCISMPGRRGWQLMKRAPELMVESLQISLNRALRQGAISGERLTGVVHHQANGLMVPLIERLLSATSWGQTAKVWDCIGRHGNTVSSTIPLALADIQDQLEHGTLVGLPSVGAGGPGYRPDVLSTGCVLMRVDRVPDPDM